MLRRAAGLIAAGVLAVACSDATPEEDAAVVIEEDAAVVDAGVVRDAGRDAGVRDGGRPDSGVVVEPDAGVVGPCSCTLGFHQECPEQFLCAGAYGGENACMEMTYQGGLEMVGACTSDAHPGYAHCTAQCTHVTSGAICHLFDSDPWIVGDIFLDAMLDSAGIISERRIDELNPCMKYLGSTILGLVKLCAGHQSLTLESGRTGNVLTDWRMRPVAQESCEFVAAQRCIGTLSYFLGDLNGEMATLTEVSAACPNGLPFDRPCDGESGIECVRERIRTMALGSVYSPN